MNGKTFFSTLIFILMVPAFGFPQQKRILFQTKEKLKDVLGEAKLKNKYVFIDCYATWCAPCKKMDKVVYTNDSIITFMKNHFISIKLQMDTSELDDEQTKSGYEDAQGVAKTFDINTFPTFLFFSPTGEIVHKGIGFKEPEEFLTLAIEALDSSKQYYTLLKAFDNGNLPFSKMPQLLKSSRSFNDKKVSKKISSLYVSGYLSKLSQKDLYTQENISFLASNGDSASIKIILKNENLINKVMNQPYYAETTLHYIIYMKEIYPIFKQKMSTADEVPNWSQLESLINKRYNSYYGHRVVTDAQIRWHAIKKDWPKFTKSAISFAAEYHKSLSNFDLNEYAWNIFLHSDDKVAITKASKWMEKIILVETDSTNALPAYIDTYANLLYKLGEKDRAIAEQTKAVDIIHQYEFTPQVERLTARLNKMKRGESTWAEYK